MEQGVDGGVVLVGSDPWIYVATSTSLQVSGGLSPRLLANKTNPRQSRSIEIYSQINEQLV